MQAPTGGSPLARRRRALNSFVGATGGSHKGDIVFSTGKGMFSPTGAHFSTTERITPDMTHSTWRPKPAVASEYEGSEDLPDIVAAGPDRKAVVRHNACFLHPHGLDDGTGFQPLRPLLSGCNYHDMVKETIHMKGSQDVERVMKHAEVSKKLAAQHNEWAQSRFRRVRDTAAMKDEMKATYDEILGRSPAPVFEDDACNDVVNQFYSTAPTLRSGSLADEARDRATADIQGRQTSRSSPLAPDLFRELEAKGFTNRPNRSASQPSLTKTRRGEGPAVRQNPGSRGHPKNFCPAVAMHTGRMMWVKDRCVTLKGLADAREAGQA